MSASLEEVRRDPAVPGAADIVVRTVVTGGPAVDELRNRSRDADLLVVGSRGKGGVRGTVLGLGAHLHSPPRSPGRSPARRQRAAV